MKKIIIGSILLVLTMAAFGQSRVGALGLTANVGYSSGSLGCEINPIENLKYLENLTIRPDLTFSFNDSSSASNSQVLGNTKKEERDNTLTFGSNVAVLYTLLKAGTIEFAAGPKFGFSYATSSHRVTVDETVSANDLVSYDSQTSSFNGGLIGNIKFFLAPNFALYSYLGIKFTTSSTKYSNALTASGGLPSGGGVGTDNGSYAFSFETPAVGAVFYLK